MPKLIVTRGLPASGKSTWAKAWVAEDPDGRVRVNRDDLRLSMFGKPHGVDENLVTVVQHAMIESALLAGKDVVSDDTNLNAKFAKSLLKIAAACNAEVEWNDSFLTVPLNECLARDEAREGSVGAEVIASFHGRYLSAGRRPKRPEIVADEVYIAEPYVADETLPEAVLIDLDGTIAKNDGHRGFFEWSKVGADKPIAEIILLVQLLWQRGIETIFVSGRDDECFSETHDWIFQHVFLPMGKFDATFQLHMRPHKDRRKDSIIKLEIFDREFRNNYNVLFCLDDRNQVVEAYRSIGLRVLQVAPGDF